MTHRRWAAVFLGVLALVPAGGPRPAAGQARDPSTSGRLINPYFEFEQPEEALRTHRARALRDLVDILLSGGSRNDYIMAITLLEEYGDRATADALYAGLATIPDSHNSARLHIREVGHVIRGRNLPSPDAKLRFWLQTLAAGSPREVKNAINELGDLGHPGAIKPLTDLMAEASLMTDEARSRLLDARRLDNRVKPARVIDHDVLAIRTALEKLRLTTAMPSVQAFLTAARSTKCLHGEHRGFVETCPMRLWGIEQLGRLGTPEATDALEKLLDEFDAYFQFLVKALKDEKRTLAARNQFDSDGSPLYVEMIVKALKRCGRAVRAKR